MTIKNPIEWTGQQLVHAARALGVFGHSLHHIGETDHASAPAVRTITAADLHDALRQGYRDFLAFRTDVVIIGIVYAVVGLILDRAMLHANLLPLLFPLASGFALLGPLAAVGLYEMSRKREQGAPVNWATVLEVFRAPAFGAIVVLGLALLVIFAAWLAAAWGIYQATLGPEMPSSLGSFARDVFLTDAGWLMIVVGCSVGLLFAAGVMTIGVISFPLLLDRDVGLEVAVKTSIRAVAANPGTMALWGLIVTGGLVLGSLPAFIGLAVVFPVLGHATWHLYRKVVRS